MKPIELAQQSLGEFKQRNGEIIAKTCPFCKPHRKDNMYKFYMNEESGAYLCYRKNECGVTGSFYELLEYFGRADEFDFDNNEDVEYKKKYIKPTTETSLDLSQKVQDYIELRGISEETWLTQTIKEKDGNIAFEYYQDGELVLIKYRTASKKKRYWQDGGGKPVLWGIDEIDPEKPLVITEGEFDRLAIIEAGYQNVVSVPFGTNNFDWVKHCWQQLEKVEQYIIWADNDEAGKKMEEEIVKRLGKYRCKVINSKHNDANLLLYKRGKEAIIKEIENAESIPISEVKQLDEVEQFDPASIPKVKSKIPLINKYFGGYMEGMVTVWTGTNGSGKSTFLNGEILEAVEQGRPTCVVSGELPNSMLRYWIELQAAGPDNVQSKYDTVRDEQSYFVGKEDKLKIRKWAKDNLLLYDDSSSLAPDKILETFKAVRQRYNCRHFVVDNLMVLEYEGGYRDKYSKQAEFIKKAKNFAKKYDSHIHIVAHPRKSEGVIKKDDIAGLYEVSNLVDNVAGIMRVNDDTKSNLPENVQDADNVIVLFKSRLYGQENIMVSLLFEPNSKRFYQYGNAEGRKKNYSWEELEID